MRAQERGRYRFTWKAYNALGGVTGALAKKADAILTGLDEVRRRAARRLLVQLVDTREDALLDTRRRVRKDKLRPGPAAEAGVFGGVLEALARERLVVLSEEEGKTKTPPIVEIAHEQIVRSWETLRGWVNEDRQKRLEIVALETWVEAAKGSTDYVLTGDLLARARVLLDKYHEDELQAAERKLIRRSIAAEEKIDGGHA